MSAPGLYESLGRLRRGSLFEVIAVLVWFLALIPFLFLLAIVLSVVFAVIGLFYMYGGFSGLRPYVGSAGLGRVGVILMVIPFINFVGIILTGIAIYSVGSKFDSGTTKIGGILTAIVVTAFIGFILTYVGLGEIMGKVGQQQQPPPAPPS